MSFQKHNIPQDHQSGPGPGIHCPGEKSSSGGETLLVPLTIWPEGDTS